MRRGLGGGGPGLGHTSSCDLAICGVSFRPSSLPGAAFTRFQTLRLQKIFPEVLAEQLISYGSCQFPTLGFVVERFKAIQAFVPEVFHKIRGLGQDLWGSSAAGPGGGLCLAIFAPLSCV